MLALVVAWVCALSGCADGDTFTQKSYVAEKTEIEKVTVLLRIICEKYLRGLACYVILYSVYNFFYEIRRKL